MASRKSTGALAREVWRELFALLMRSAPARTGSLARRGLTPNDSRALFSLESRRGRPMRALADEWGCDPSYATWLVDRLETMGLVRRQVVPDDRRIKLVRLTRKGGKTRADLMREFHEPPPEIAGLARADLEALSRILERVAPAAPPPPRAPRP
jgi:DNA-binding MarR family transcriptional regulator